MNEQQRIAYVVSQAAALMATVLGMQAENEMRKIQGYQIAYDHKAFEDAVVAAGMTHNQVLAYLGGY